MKKIIAVVLITVLSIFIYLIWASRYNQLTIKTNVVPLKFELGNNVYSISSKSTRIRVKPGAFNYRASALADGIIVPIVDRVDLSNSDQNIVLDYSIYNKGSIKNTLCLKAKSYCNIATDKMQVIYVEDYLWAVVKVSNPGQEISRAVLTLNHGKWQIVGGPGTSIPSSGVYPTSIQEALAQ